MENKTPKNNTKGKKVLKGTVVSSRNHCTIVKVNRLAKHEKYQKYLKISKKYKAHDYADSREVGEAVLIEECRPISKDKHFRVVKSEEVKV